LQAATAGWQEDLRRKFLGLRGFAGGVERGGKRGRAALKFLLRDKRGLVQLDGLGSGDGGALGRVTAGRRNRQAGRR
jgi:hypothetical protein